MRPSWRSLNGLDALVLQIAKKEVYFKVETKAQVNASMQGAAFGDCLEAVADNACTFLPSTPGMDNYCRLCTPRVGEIVFGFHKLVQCPSWIPSCNTAGPPSHDLVDAWFYLFLCPYWNENYILKLTKNCILILDLGNYQMNGPSLYASPPCTNLFD